MRSPVGWICFGVSLLCAISANSRVEGNYQIVHYGHGLGYPGPVFQRFVPTIGYTRVVPQIVAQRVETQSNDDNDEHEQEQNKKIHRKDYNQDEDDEDEAAEDEEEEEEEEEEEDSREYRQRPSINAGSRASHSSQNAEEDEYGGEGGNTDEEEEMNSGTSQHHHLPEPDDGELEEEHTAHFDDKDGMTRQAYESKFHPDATSPAIARKSPRKSPKKSNKKTNSSRKKKPSVATTKPVEASVPVEALPISVSPQNLAAIDDTKDANKQKIQYKPVAMSSQFIATPVADLIVRLSISLAKPVGHGNGTYSYFNVPIRIPETIIKGIADNSSSIVSKGDSELRKPEPVVMIPEPIKVKNETVTAEQTENQKIDVAEDDDGKEPAATLPLTELPKE